MHMELNRYNLFTQPIITVTDKKDEKELEEYIRNVYLVLAPNHYLLLDAKQRLAGVLRDAINREPRPTKKLMRRKIELCHELLPVIETLSPGICRSTGNCFILKDWYVLRHSFNG